MDNQEQYLKIIVQPQQVKDSKGKLVMRKGKILISLVDENFKLHPYRIIVKSENEKQADEVDYPDVHVLNLDENGICELKNCCILAVQGKNSKGGKDDPKMHARHMNCVLKTNSLINHEEPVQCIDVHQYAEAMNKNKVSYENGAFQGDDEILKEEAKERAKTMDLNICLIRFQLVLQDGNLGLYYPPIYSNPIRNARTNKGKMFKINSMQVITETLEGSVMGDTRMNLDCSNIDVDDMEICIYDEKVNPAEEEPWSVILLGKRDVVNNSVRFTMPRYRDVHITEPVKVFIRIRRKSNGNCGSTGDTPFIYIPKDSYMSRKRKITSTQNQKESPIEFHSFDAVPDNSAAALQDPLKAEHQAKRFCEINFVTVENNNPIKADYGITGQNGSCLLSEYLLRDNTNQVASEAPEDASRIVQEDQAKLAVPRQNGFSDDQEFDLEKSQMFYVITSQQKSVSQIEEEQQAQYNYPDLQKFSSQVEITVLQEKMTVPYRQKLSNQVEFTVLQEKTTVPIRPIQVQVQNQQQRLISGPLSPMYLNLQENHQSQNLLHSTIPQVMHNSKMESTTIQEEIAIPMDQNNYQAENHYENRAVEIPVAPITSSEENGKIVDKSSSNELLQLPSLSDFRQDNKINFDLSASDLNFYLPDDKITSGMDPMLPVTTFVQ